MSFYLNKYFLFRVRLLTFLYKFPKLTALDYFCVFCRYFHMFKLLYNYHTNIYQFSRVLASCSKIQVCHVWCNYPEHKNKAESKSYTVSSV